MKRHTALTLAAALLMTPSQGTALEAPQPEPDPMPPKPERQQKARHKQPAHPTSPRKGRRP